MSVVQEINFRVNQLPEKEQLLILELIRRIDPDDILTEEDIADIAEAHEEYARGEYVRHEDINWN